MYQHKNKAWLSDDETILIADFMEKMQHFPFKERDRGIKSILRGRVMMMREEVDEFSKAVDDLDMAELADALVDLVYYAKGTAVILNLPWSDLFTIVHEANMKKVSGQTKRGLAEDAAKPEGWQPPNVRKVLEDHNHGVQIEFEDSVD